MTSLSLHQRALEKAEFERQNVQTYLFRNITDDACGFKPVLFLSKSEHDIYRNKIGLRG